MQTLGSEAFGKLHDHLPVLPNKSYPDIMEDPALVSELEKAGNIKLTQPICSSLSRELQAVMALAEIYKNSLAGQAIRRTLSSFKKDIKKFIVTYSRNPGLRFHDAIIVSLLQCKLVELDADLDGGARSSGRPRDFCLDLLVMVCAKHYQLAGGRVAASSTGPFSRFLSALFVALPSYCRPPTPDALIARAKLLKARGTIPRTDVSLMGGSRTDPRSTLPLTWLHEIQLEIINDARQEKSKKQGSSRKQ